MHRAAACFELQRGNREDPRRLRDARLRERRVGVERVRLVQLALGGQAVAARLRSRHSYSARRGRI